MHALEMNIEKLFGKNVGSDNILCRKLFQGIYKTGPCIKPVLQVLFVK